MLRSLLGCALVILVSMALQIPFLALSLIVVFYVTQTNVVVTRLIGSLFVVGSTLAIGLSILLLKFTYDHPMLRILGASLLFFCSTFLMRTTRIGTVFFVIGIVVIYSQSFADLTDQGEIVLRQLLWVWVAVNYAIMLTLLINTLFLPLEPQKQLRTHLLGQLQIIAASLLPDTATPAARMAPLDLQRSLLASRQLLPLRQHARPALPRRAGRSPGPRRRNLPPAPARPAIAGNAQRITGSTGVAAGHPYPTDRHGKRTSPALPR
ncbi:hypothetical protein ACNUIT_33425 [Pseudomonas aeruginosa]|uniref:hypothetical protein n=1 Tax=Pseudomonas aeruginosa TaxID=287 RepID=UPI003AAF7F08